MSDAMLGRLFRGVRPVCRVSRDFADGAAGLRRLQRAIPDRIQLAAGALRALMDEPDLSALQRALSRLASAGPPGPEPRSSGLSPRGYGQAAAAGPRAPGWRSGKADQDRVTELLEAAAAPVAAEPGTAAGLTARRSTVASDPLRRSALSGRAGRRPDERRADERKAHERGADRAEGLRWLRLRAERAGADAALQRWPGRLRELRGPVEALLRDGGLGAQGLRQVTDHVLAEAELARGEMRGTRHRALERMNELVTVILNRPSRGADAQGPAGAAARTQGHARPLSRIAQAPMPGTGPGAGALRRFAERLADPGAAAPEGALGSSPGPVCEGLSGTGRGWSGQAAGAVDRQDLLDRLNEILLDEARRHGIDTEGLVP